MVNDLTIIQHNLHLVATSSASGLGALGIDPKTLIIQLITFVLAYMVLRKWAFGPIVKILNRRREIIEDGVKLGEKMRHDEADLEQKIEKELHRTRAEADQIIGEASATAKQLIRDAETDAKKRADILIKEAQDKTELEVKRIRRRLENEMVNLVAQATSAVLDEKVDAKKDAGLIERALAGRKEF